MGPYELCWCRSGKKYKWCHFRREQQEPINIFEIEARMIAELRDGYCSYPDPSADPCSRTITKAHTVQKKGGLTAIAEEGHVLTVKPTMKDMIETQGNPQPRRIGINNASVFPGFCSKHDNNLFKPIEEKSLSITRDTAFLFSYRAIAYERFAKEAQLRTADIQREADRGHPFWKQALIQEHLVPFIAGIKIGIQDTDRWKTRFDDYLISGARDGFHFLAVRFNQVLPVVGCGAFHPEFDLQGNPLQRLGRDSVGLEHITLTVSTFSGQTIAVFGWIGSDDGPAAALAKSFVATDDVQKADALIRLLFIQTDNLFLSPGWWRALPEASKQVLNELTRSGTTMRVRSGAEMSGNGTSFFSAGVIDVISS